MTHLPRNTVLGNLKLAEVFQYFDGPKLFSCFNTTGQYYLVFWLGDDGNKDSWLYVPISSPRLSMARSGTISLKNICLNSENEYVFKVETITTDFEKSTITYLKSSELKDEDLPAEDAYLNLPAETIPKLEESVIIRAERSIRDVVDLSLRVEGENRSDIAVNILGKALVNVQALIESIVYAKAGYVSRFGRTPKHLSEKARLNVIGVFPSSFGIRLEAENQSDMFGESEVYDALKDFNNLIVAGINAEKLKLVLSDLGGKVAARYAILLDSMAANLTDLKVNWASPKFPGKSQSSEIGYRNAKLTAQILYSTLDQFIETIKINCDLVGLDVHTKKFDLINLESNGRMVGNISDSFIKEVKYTRVPAKYIATLEQVEEVVSLTGETREKYTLVLLESS